MMRPAILGAAALVLTAWSEPPRSMPAEPIPCAVARVLDGDTIACADGTRARLRGVDTPERGEPRHAEATAALAAMLARCGAWVVLIPHHMTRGRIAATVMCGGVDVGAAMDRAGWSKPIGARR